MGRLTVKYCQCTHKWDKLTLKWFVEELPNANRLKVSDC